MPHPRSDSRLAHTRMQGMDTFSNILFVKVQGDHTSLTLSHSETSSLMYVIGSGLTLSHSETLWVGPYTALLTS